MAIIPISQVAIYGHNAGFVGLDLQTIVAICGAESGYNSSAHALTSLEDSRGLAQINVYAHPWGRMIDLYNPQTNLYAAWRVYKESGYSFRPWSTFLSGSYRNYWAAAGRAMGNIPPGSQPPPTVVYIRPPTDVPDDYSGHIRLMSNTYNSELGRLLGIVHLLEQIPH